MDLELLKFGRVLYGDVGKCAARDALRPRDHNVSVCTVRMTSELSRERRGTERECQQSSARMQPPQSQFVQGVGKTPTGRSEAAVRYNETPSPLAAPEHAQVRSTASLSSSEGGRQDASERENRHRCATFRAEVAYQVRVPGESMALFGERNRSGGAVEEPHANSSFETRDGPTHTGWSQT
jgi:hypothetical protein